MSRIFITGGSGFIGTAIVRLARQAGHEVCIYDLVAPGIVEHRAWWVEGDVRDLPALQQAAQAFAPDYFMHLASDIDVSIVDLKEFKTTIDGTRNALAVAATLPIKRFLHTSTQFVVKPGIEPVNERHLDPYTVYGEAKAVAEKLVWDADLSMPWVMVRPVIIWGPRHPSFADQIFRHIATGKYLHPSGRTINRAFGYVENVAEQMLLLATMPADRTDRHIFYVGDGQIDYDIWADAFSNALTGRRARRIPAALLLTLGKIGDLVKSVGIPSPIDGGRAFRMTTSSRVDLAPTIAITGTPRVSFDAGVLETLAWLREVDPVRFAGHGMNKGSDTTS